MPHDVNMLCILWRRLYLCQCTFAKVEICAFSAQQSKWNRNLSVVGSSASLHIPSVSQFFSEPNARISFSQVLVVASPDKKARTFVYFFLFFLSFVCLFVCLKNTFSDFLRLSFSFSLIWDRVGAKISKLHAS